jgi:hypothetical protein
MVMILVRDKIRDNIYCPTNNAKQKERDGGGILRDVVDSSVLMPCHMQPTFILSLGNDSPGIYLCGCKKLINSQNIQ